MADIARVMQIKSASIRRDFASHRPSAGSARECLVEKFLINHLPKRFEVTSGLVFSSNDLLSNQADLLIVDGMSNAALYGELPSKKWPVESVYALIEVKTSLTPHELKDAINKGKKFKNLPRKFLKSGSQKIKQSLFVIWGYDCPDLKTLKKNLEELLKDVPRNLQPDLIIVPDKVVVQLGEMRELAQLGEVNSPHRRKLEELHGPDLSKILIGEADVNDYGENSLLTWYIWLDSWLRHAGARFTDPIDYSLGITGKKVFL